MTPVFHIDKWRMDSGWSIWIKNPPPDGVYIQIETPDGHLIVTTSDAVSSLMVDANGLLWRYTGVGKHQMETR